MVLFARSDSAAVNGIPDGCGGTHSRPVVDGVPQHPWGLSCPPCENWLRVHMPDQWSTTVAEIPETHDEKIIREDFEKRGAKDKDAVMTLALARLAGIPAEMLPDSMVRMISGQPMHVPQVTAGMLVCPEGHNSPAGQRFCGQCGASLSAPVAKASIAAPQEPSRPPSEPAADVKVPRMRDGRIDVLKAFAAANSLDDRGTRADLIPRLSKAGLVGKWNDFAAPYYTGSKAA